MGASPHPSRAPHNRAFVRCCRAFFSPASPTCVRSSSAWGDKTKGGSQGPDINLTLGGAWVRERGILRGKDQVPFPSCQEVNNQEDPTPTPRAARGQISLSKKWILSIRGPCSLMLDMRMRPEQGLVESLADA